MMKSKVLWLVCCVLVLGISNSSLQAAYTIQNGCIVNVCEAAKMSVEDHYSAASNAMEACDWDEGAIQFNIIMANFPTSPYAQDSYFYMGICYYNLAEYDIANEMFTDYLKMQRNPKFFQETIEYKYAIAKKFSLGAKRRFFCTKKLPKWGCGKAMALQIYDEVIAAVPCHEITAQALVSKGYLLWSMKDYRPAIDSFQLVVRRFPKHELAPECYLLISHVYLEQGCYEFQNPDILAFAQINLRRFERDFPREERLCEAEQDVMSIKEIYAQGLYDTGQFYERMHKPRAAIIYYQNAIHQFRDTCVADLCRQRLSCLDPSYCGNDPRIDEECAG